MKRMPPTSADLTLIQAFVLGRLRDAGPMRGKDFAEARRGEMGNGGSEWAKPILNKLRDLGYATSVKGGRSETFSITPAGLAAIADMPLTPARLAAFPDREGNSLCLVSASRWLKGAPPEEITPEAVRNGMSLTGDLDEAETREMERIAAILTGAARKDD